MNLEDMYSNKTGWIIGERARVFDAIEWQKTGDVEDNGQFLKPATIVKIYKEERTKFKAGCKLMMLVDVKFDHRDPVSKGHFLYCIERL